MPYLARGCGEAAGANTAIDNIVRDSDSYRA